MGITDKFIVLSFEKAPAAAKPSASVLEATGRLRPDDLLRSGRTRAHEAAAATRRLRVTSATKPPKPDGENVGGARVMPLRLFDPAKRAKAKPAAGSASWGVTAVGADASPYDGSGVVVGVLDTGIDTKHPAFNGVTIVRKNFTQESGDDIDGHGTHCAATILGRDVGGQRIGIARGVTRLIVGKVLGAGGGSTLQLASAIQWAVDQGAQIISMSLGIDFPGYVADRVKAKVPADAAASDALAEFRHTVRIFDTLTANLRSTHEVLIVAATGNESDRPRYTIACSPPANADGIIPVGAVDQSGSIAEFSNTGPLVVAPGVDIVSAEAHGTLVTMSGTSMATPHVAGVAALWAQKALGAGSPSAVMLAARVLASASLPGGSGVQADMGAGMVQAPRH